MELDLKRDFFCLFILSGLVEMNVKETHSSEALYSAKLVPVKGKDE